ncbi:hypothetical protein [Arthrobacter sp. UYEF3]|uniref:hypothetical protein n=1 Tax=Arthrobacter sp. UYEF3 TaxID=1756365 RepID=UPI003392E4DE
MIDHRVPAAHTVRRTVPGCGLRGSSRFLAVVFTVAAAGSLVPVVLDRAIGTPPGGVSSSRS